MLEELNFVCLNKRGNCFKIWIYYTLLKQWYILYEQGQPTYWTLSALKSRTIKIGVIWFGANHFLQNLSIALPPSPLSEAWAACCRQNRCLRDAMQSTNVTDWQLSKAQVTLKSNIPFVLLSRLMRTCPKAAAGVSTPAFTGAEASNSSACKQWTPNYWDCSFLPFD